LKYWQVIFTTPLIVAQIGTKGSKLDRNYYTGEYKVQYKSQTSDTWTWLINPSTGTDRFQGNNDQTADGSGPEIKNPTGLTAPIYGIRITPTAGGKSAGLNKIALQVGNKTIIKQNSTSSSRSIM
jgi:hypothetical protein